MSGAKSPRRRVAERLLAHAERRLPIARREWAQAMRAELAHIQDERRALRWAGGCVLASYKERWRYMHRSDLRVAPWVLGIESLLCFLPLTLLWIVAILNLKRLSAEPDTLFAVALTTIAPLSLILALRFVAIRKLPNYKIHIALACGFGVLGVRQLAAAYMTRGARFAWFELEWGLVVLFSILPAMCSLHLAHLAKPSLPPTAELHA